jgi:hypothetical protein
VNVTVDSLALFAAGLAAGAALTLLALGWGLGIVQLVIGLLLDWRA